MNDTTATVESIRRTELEAAREVEAARDTAEETLARAREEASRIRDEGERRGRERAAAMLEEAKAAAEREAEEIRASAAGAADAIGEGAHERFDELVDTFVRVVLSPPAESEG